MMLFKVCIAKVPEISYRERTVKVEFIIMIEKKTSKLVAIPSSIALSHTFAFSLII